MAESKKEELVSVFVPMGNQNDDPNLFVSVNGKNWLLPRGKTSKVPPHIKYEVERATMASQRAQARMKEMLEASK